MNKEQHSLNRRNFLGGFGALGIGAGLSNVCAAAPSLSYRGLKNIGSLSSPDQLGIRLPKGFSSKVVAEFNGEIFSRLLQLTTFGFICSSQG